MSFLTDDTFYSVTFKALSNSAWSGVTPYVTIPSEVVDSITNSVPLTLYVIDAADGVFATTSGQGSGFADSLVQSSTVLSDHTFTNTGSLTQRWAATSSGSRVVIFTSAGVLIEYSSVEAAALKAWLP